MQEIQYILENLGQRTLVLVDELADNSSVAASRPIAWSICEYLSTTSRVHVLLSTHNTVLCSLQACYPFVHTLHLQSLGKSKAECHG